MALALVLLVGAGLLLKSFARLQNVDPGFDPHNVLTMEVALPVAKYPRGQPVVRFLCRGHAARPKRCPGSKRLRSLPFFRSAGSNSDSSFAIEGRDPRAGERLSGRRDPQHHPGLFSSPENAAAPGAFLQRAATTPTRPDVVIINQVVRSKMVSKLGRGRQAHHFQRSAQARSEMDHDRRRGRQHATSRPRCRSRSPNTTCRTRRIPIAE